MLPRGGGEGTVGGRGDTGRCGTAGRVGSLGLTGRGFAAPDRRGATLCGFPIAGGRGFGVSGRRGMLPSFRASDAEPVLFGFFPFGFFPSSPRAITTTPAASTTRLPRCSRS